MCHHIVDLLAFLRVGGSLFLFFILFCNERENLKMVDTFCFFWCRFLLVHVLHSYIGSLILGRKKKGKESNVLLELHLKEITFFLRDNDIVLFFFNIKKNTLSNIIGWPFQIMGFSIHIISNSFFFFFLSRETKIVL